MTVIVYLLSFEIVDKISIKLIIHFLNNWGIKLIKNLNVILFNKTFEK